MNTDTPELSTMLLPLDEAAAEVVFAPFHDPVISPTLLAKFAPAEAVAARLTHGWDGTLIDWDACPPGRTGGALLLEVNVPLAGYDRIVLCLVVPPGVQLRAECQIDDQWRPAVEAQGQGVRQEVFLPADGQRLTQVRVSFVPSEPGRTHIKLNWFGLCETELAGRMRQPRMRWDPRWPGLIREQSAWGDPRFACRLVFSEEDLPRLREKKMRPSWRAQWAELERSAEQYLQRVPETQITGYIPWSDGRYMRSHQRQERTWFFEPLTLAIVGLVNNDARMIHHALRYLMCYCHTWHWCQSEESRVLGSTWTQRCFMEEMSATAVALLADWLDFALTDRARDLICQSLWDRGLAVIERDMMKFEYVHHMNQGPWFCRARVLGGLLLEKFWPRLGDYVDRAMREMRGGLENYVLPDGGTDEGLGYFSLTFSMVLPAMIAYGRSRGIDPVTLLPGNFPQVERFVATMSAVEPGHVLMDGDNSYDRFVGDAIPILAAMFPGSVYASLAGACIGRPRPETYFYQYLYNSELAFVLGPQDVAPPATVVPAFAVLDQVGHLTSFRRAGGQSIRLHLSGAKARASHSHFDKGGFTLEVDGRPVLIDRGMVRYDLGQLVPLLKTSAMHNVITPVLPGDVWPDQAPPEQAVIPAGRGDDKSLEASIDIGHVWRRHMQSCRRTIRSRDLRQFEVIDEGELLTPGPVAFHLHALRPFEVGGQAVHLPLETGGTLRITAGWAERITSSQDSIDFQGRPVHHLVIVSRPLSRFALTTTFDRI